MYLMVQYKIAKSTRKIQMAMRYQFVPSCFSTSNTKVEKVKIPAPKLKFLGIIMLCI